MSTSREDQFLAVWLDEIHDEAGRVLRNARNLQEQLQDQPGIPFSLLEILYYAGDLTEGHLTDLKTYVEEQDLDLNFDYPVELNANILARGNFCDLGQQKEILDQDDCARISEIHDKIAREGVDVPEGVIAVKLKLIGAEEARTLDEREESSSDQKTAGDLGQPLQSTVFTMDRMLGVDSDVDLEDPAENFEGDSPEYPGGPGEGPNRGGQMLPESDEEEFSSFEEEEEETEENLMDESLGEKYVVIKKLGEGHMGKVVEAEDVDFRRDVAVKVLREDHRKEQKRLKRFLEEAQVQAQLEHPTIPPVYEMGMTRPERVFFSMQKIQGDSLRGILDRIRDGDEQTRNEYSLRRLLELLKRVCEGVAYAHDRGVIHRDIKPENIMIGSYGEVHLVDWGLAKVMGYEDPHGQEDQVVSDQREEGVLVSRSGSVFGTPAYMPPEQARGEVEQLDERSDIYALGGILYRILTLEPPVMEEDVQEALERVKKNDIVPPSERAPERDIPPELESVTMKAMTKDPEERYGSAEEMGNEIEAFLEGRVLETASYNPLYLIWKWLLLHRTVSVSGLVFLLSVAGFFGYRTYERQQQYQTYVREAKQAAEAGSYRAAARKYDRAGEVTQQVLMEKKARLMRTRNRLKEYREKVREGDRKMEEESFREALTSYQQAEEKRRELDTRTLILEGWVSRDELKELKKKRAKARRARDRKNARTLMNEADRLIREAEEKTKEGTKRRLLKEARHEIWNAVELVPGKEEWQKKLERLSRRVSALEMARMSRELRLLTDLFERIKKHRKTGKPLDPLFEKANSIKEKLRKKNTPDAWWMMGLLSYVLGQDRTALEHYRTSLKKDQDHKLALVGLGRALIERGIARMFRPAGHRAARQRKRTVGRKFIKEGVGYLKSAQKQGKPDLLLRVRPSFLKQYLNRNLEIAPLFRLMGEQKYGELMKIIRNRRKKKEDGPVDLLYIRGIAGYLKSNQRKQNIQSIQALRKYVQKREGAYRGYFFLGIGFLRVEKLTNAIQSHSRVVKINPRYWRGYFARGNIYHDLGKYKKAIADFNRTIETGPKFASPYNQRGLTYEKMGKFKKALKDYKRASSIDPEHVNSYLNRGNVYRKQKKYKKALKEYRKAQDLAPRYGMIFLNRGALYQLQGKDQKAIEQYNKAIKRNSKMKKVYSNRGTLKCRRGQYKEALKDFRRANQLDPTYVGAYNNRGLCKKKRGKFKEAIPDFTRALELDPERFNPRISRAESRMSIGNLEGAKTDLTRLIEMGAGVIRAYTLRAKVNKKQGRLKAAISDYSFVIEKRPNFAAAYANRGLAYRELGYSRRAISNLRKALKKAPENWNERRRFKQLIDSLKQRISKKKNNVEETIENGKKSTKPKPITAQLFVQRGQKRLNRAEFLGAIASFSRAIERDPDHLRAYRGRAEARMIRGDYSGAIADFRQIIKRNPGDPEAHFNLGLIRKEQEKLGAAMKNFEKALQAKSDYARAHLQRGLILLSQDKLQMALTSLNRAVSEASQNEKGKTFFLRGIIHKKRKKFEKAVEDFTAVIQNVRNRFGGNDSALNVGDSVQGKRNGKWQDARILERNEGKYKIHYEGFRKQKAEVVGPERIRRPGVTWYIKSLRSRADIRVSVGDYEEAVKDLKKLIELHSKPYRAYVRLGRIRKKQKSYQAAIRNYSRALELNEEFTEAYVHRGLMYKNTGSLVKALKDFRKALKTSSKDWKHREKVKKLIRKIKRQRKEGTNRRRNQ